MVVLFQVLGQVSTALYIENILTKLTTIGTILNFSLFNAKFLIANYPIPFYLGGTSILIVVVVAIILLPKFKQD